MRCSRALPPKPARCGKRQSPRTPKKLPLSQSVTAVPCANAYHNAATWHTLRRMRCHFYGVLFATCLLLACQDTPTATPADAGTSDPDQGMPPVTVGLLQDCTPPGAGYGDVVCAAGLRCSVVLLGDGPTPGALLQCVPMPKPEQTITEGQTCAFDQQLTSPTEPVKHFDRCAAGLGCVQTPSHDFQCQRLCEIRQRSSCGKTALCVQPAQVSGIGFCTPADSCQAVAPQSGCPVSGGKQLACYVLGDNKGTASFCMAQQPYGDGKGALNAACDRAWHCQAGLGCVAPTGHESMCRPYCTLPTVPDGGTPADLGSGDVLCPGNQGICHPITGYPGVGRCY